MTTVLKTTSLETAIKKVRTSILEFDPTKNYSYAQLSKMKSVIEKASSEANLQMNELNERTVRRGVRRVTVIATFPIGVAVEFREASDFAFQTVKKIDAAMKKLKESEEKSSSSSSGSSSNSYEIL